MTREEAIDALYRTDKLGVYSETHKAVNMAIEALDQESIIDKIRMEVADIYCGQYCENPMTAYEVKEQVLDIIDKYIIDEYCVKSEDKE